MRISDPTQIDHPQLREFAVQAAWVAKLKEAVGVLEELVVDLGDDDRPQWTSRYGRRTRSKSRGLS